MKVGIKVNLENITLENSDYRKVVYTGQHSQLVLMSLKPGVEIGLEVHEEDDQFFRIEKGEGKVTINEMEYLVADGDAVIVPAGAKHNVVNISDTEDLKLYTIYSPPHHKDGVVNKEKGDEYKEEFDGKTTEN